MMTQSPLPFQYKQADDMKLTGFAGLPLYIELAIKCGLQAVIESTLQTRKQGWQDSELILSLLLLNLAGGDCISDIERLEQDAGLRTLLLRFATHGMKRKERRAYEKRWRKAHNRALPSNAAVHRFLPHFHNEAEEAKRVKGEAFIPSANPQLQALCDLTRHVVNYTQQQGASEVATLDQDATLINTHKRTALYSYKQRKAYQPLNTYWAEQGLIVHSEFRDGNVPAGFEQQRVLEEAIANLPPGVTTVRLRSDSAGYQANLLRYCAEGRSPLGVIEFAVAAKVSQAFKAAANEVKETDWQPIYKQDNDGNRIQTTQEWAEVCFIPQWAAISQQQPSYRYIAIREPMKNSASADESSLPFQTLQADNTTYKLFGIVTNRTLDGHELIHWHRERCGESEAVHSTQKQGLAGGQLPSNRFGANAAWWQIMILAFNLNRLMEKVALPASLQSRQMKALRFHMINLPGRIITHARQLYVQVDKQTHELLQNMRECIAKLVPNIRNLGIDTT